MASKQDFLEIEEGFDVQTLVDPQQQPPTRSIYAQSQQPSPMLQLHQQQAQRTMDAMIQSFGTEAGKSQAAMWAVAQQGAAGLPGLLKKAVQLGALIALATFGDGVIEPVVHVPIAKHFITSVAPGDGNAYAYNPAVPFAEQHWSIKGKTRQAVNTILFAVGALALVFWEPSTPVGVSFKYKFLLFLAFLAAPIALF